MSTKTTFKRIALVAVAALGLGVLSVAPSSAGVANLTLTVSNGTAAAGKSDSATAATISVAGMMDIGAADSITVTFIAKDISANTAAVAQMSYLDTTTGSSNGTLVSSSRGIYAAAVKWGSSAGTADSKTASSAPFVVFSGSPAYVGAKFGVQLESKTAQLDTAGVFTYTALVSAYAGATLVSSTSADFTITIAALASASTTVAPASTSAFICAGDVSTCAADTAPTASATNDTTVDATIILNLKNAAGSTTAAKDSVTATVAGAGLISFDGITYGKSVKIASTGSQQIRVLGDGTAGVSTVSISTLSGFSTTKSVTFYASAAKTITAKVNNPVLVVGANSKAISATAVDANGTAWTGVMYIYAVAAADALIGGSATTPVACGYDPAKLVHYCPVTTIAAGSASFKLIDATTVALATATSDAVTVKVSSATAATVKLAFDKATYGPYEKAIITVTPLDSTGSTLGGQTFATLLASGGITGTQAFTSGSDTLTAASITTSADSSSSAPRTAGAFTYVVYMPAQGTVTISATGGVSLAAAGQVAVAATASVVNSSVDAATDAANEATDAANAATDAALAAADAADAATAAAQDASDAVAALSATVATLVASLKAQITSLTNLVIKIQKKVKA